MRATSSQPLSSARRRNGRDDEWWRAHVPSLPSAFLQSRGSSFLFSGSDDDRVRELLLPALLYCFFSVFWWPIDAMVVPPSLCCLSLVGVVAAAPSVREHRFFYLN